MLWRPQCSPPSRQKTRGPPIEDDTLDRLVRGGRGKTSTTQGYGPAEGAVFPRLGARAERGALGFIVGPGEADEPAVPGSERPNLAAGLTQAARRALADAGVDMPTVGLVVQGAF